MLLSDIDIKKAIQEKKIVITPLPDFSESLSACAIDLRLHNEFGIFEHNSVPFFDIKKMTPETFIKKMKVLDDDRFILHPGEFALASTLESVTLPNDIAGRLEGRSSLARLGIIVHSTAALIYPGVKGRIVLELSNLSNIPVALYPGMRVCALSFELLSSPTSIPYGSKKSKYNLQTSVVGSKIQED